MENKQHQLELHLNDFLNKMDQINRKALTFVLGSENEDSWGLGVVTNVNPMEFSEPLTSFLIKTNQRHLNNKDGEMQLQDYTLYSLVNAVMNYLNKMNFLEKLSKYKRFSEGDLSGLSDNELDEFLNLKVEEINRNRDNLIPLICRLNSKNSILYSPEYGLILSLAHDLHLNQFNVRKLKTKLKGFNELDELYSLTFDVHYDWDKLIEIYNKLSLDKIKLINYETHEVYSKYISN